MPPTSLINPAEIDTSQVLFDIETIRKANPQRFEMEQLTAIVQLDVENQFAVGYKDIGADEFWVRGHMPDYPLMPGVIMCEAAAQLCAYLTHTLQVLKKGFMGFGGMEDVRFRGQVKPGDRLLIAAKAVRLDRRQTQFQTQGFVNGDMVFQAKIIGVPIQPTKEAEPENCSNASSAPVQPMLAGAN